jgi:biotin synthase
MSDPPASVSGILRRAEEGASVTREEILLLLSLPAGEERETLFRTADAVRRREVGDEVFFRGIIEFSNVCERDCLYCGLRRSNRRLHRYRMPTEEILETAGLIREAGIATIVLQSGEDSAFTADNLCRMISRIRGDYGLTVTLSVGERPDSEYRAFRDAGAGRYLLKHETSSPTLYSRMRPGCLIEERLRCLKTLGDLGYEVGTGNIIGLPGQTRETLAEDLLLMRDIDADMLGIGPLIPHADTPLAGLPAGDGEMTLRVLAVARLLTRSTNIPATTALMTLDPGLRMRALGVGANVVMPDFTPGAYRRHYAIYPGRNDALSVRDFLRGLGEEITLAGRRIGSGSGGRKSQSAPGLS